MIRYPKETIPDSDFLYRHIPKQHLYDDNTKIKPMTFKNGANGGMSTDWTKYSTPKESLERHNPKFQGRVVILNVGQARQIPNQTVKHTPSHSNRAHSDVFGSKDDEEIRLKFLEICDWVL